jgi:D-alanyl-D-alanine carboxypeptidase (penicillin-binding protein 5/6)
LRRALISFALVALLATPVAAAMTRSPAAPAPKLAPAKPGAATQPAKTKPGGPPQLKDAKAYVLVDPRDGTVLDSKAAHRKLPIASTTKLMTAFLALERLKPSQMLKAPRYNAAAAESLLGLRVGEKMSVRDLIFALVIESANDAAETLAVGVSGSVPAFVNQMNAEAQKLGLTETHYSTPVGLDSPGNYSSANDLTKLATLLLKNPLFAQAANSPSATLKTGDERRTIQNRNLLVGTTPYVTGVKTGHTLKAGYVLVGSGEQHGTTLISAVLGTPSEAARDNDTLALLNYGFSQYRGQTPVKKGAEQATPTLDWGRGDLPLVAAKTLQVDIRQGQKVATRVNAPSDIKGSVADGEKLGAVQVTVDGKPAGASPLLATKAVAAASTLDKVTSILFNPLVLVPLGLLVLLAGIWLARREGGPHRPHIHFPSVDRKSLPKVSLPKREPKSPRTAADRERMRDERMRRRAEQSRSREE